MRIKLYVITTIAVCLAFIVVVLGAYTRLTNAGLGCPDWPGCYGQLTPLTAKAQGLNARAAWTEMVHRYCAGTVGFLILCLNIMVLRQRDLPKLTPAILLAMVCFQAMLGMWTVTLKLHPLVVMAHLLGGLTTLTLLWRYRLKLDNRFVTTMSASERRWETWSVIGLIILVTQIALGGWVSSNYAGLSCVGFPACNGSLLPPIHLNEAFSVAEIGPNYEGGLLSSAARVSIQMVHRLGALITAVYMVTLGLWLWFRARSYRLRKIGLVLVALTAVQFSLGILNVVYLLPLSVAVLHNAVAALLLLSIVTLNSATVANRGEWFHA